MNVMIDIETLGTTPGAVIVSLGAVRFDADGIEEEMYRSIDMESAQDSGLNIEASTLEWWIPKPPEVQEQLTGGKPLLEVLYDLRSFVDDDIVWACSPAFDIVMLEAAYRAVGAESPWRYYNCRDYRTLRETLGTWPDREQQGTNHDALDDARYQAKCLIEAVTESEDVSI